MGNGCPELLFNAEAFGRTAELGKLDRGDQATANHGDRLGDVVADTVLDQLVIEVASLGSSNKSATADLEAHAGTDKKTFYRPGCRADTASHTADSGTGGRSGEAPLGGLIQALITGNGHGGAKISGGSTTGHQRSPGP